MKPALKGLCLTMSIVLMIGCSSGDPEVENAITKLSVAGELESFHYFVGGGYPTPNGANWSYDLTVTPNANGSITVEAKVSDPLCGKSGTLTRAELSSFLSLISGLRFARNNLDTMDAGETSLTLNLANSPDQVLHLEQTSAPKGELYAVNGTALREALEDLNDSLPTFCQ